MTEREANREVINLRSTLTSRYTEWKKTRKSGMEHLPIDPQQEDLERVKGKLKTEMEALESLESCCNSLREELNKEWRKV